MCTLIIYILVILVNVVFRLWVARVVIVEKGTALNCWSRWIARINPHDNISDIRAETEALFIHPLCFAIKSTETNILLFGIETGGLGLESACMYVRVRAACAWHLTPSSFTAVGRPRLNLTREYPPSQAHPVFPARCGSMFLAPVQSHNKPSDLTTIVLNVIKTNDGMKLKIEMKIRNTTDAIKVSQGTYHCGMFINY